MKVFLAILTLTVSLPSALAQKPTTTEDRRHIYSLALLDLTTKELSSDHLQAYCVRAAKSVMQPKELTQLIDFLQKSNKNFTSQAGCTAKRGSPVYTKHGQPAVILGIGSIELTSPTQAKVNASYFAAPEGAAENAYLLEKRHDRWIIAKKYRLWISFVRSPSSTYPLPTMSFNADTNTGHAFGIFMACVGPLRASRCGAG